MIHGVLWDVLLRVGRHGSLSMEEVAMSWLFSFIKDALLYFSSSWKVSSHDSSHVIYSTLRISHLTLCEHLVDIKFNFNKDLNLTKDICSMKRNNLN